MISDQSTRHLVPATARVGATACLAALGVLHGTWALGSPWPASSGPRLADAVVGAQVPPRRAPTAVVSAVLLLSAATVSGALGTARSRRWTSIGLGAAFTARAVLGGSTAARVITHDVPSPRFVRLDRCVYRPLCAAIAAMLLASAAAQDSPAA